MKRHLAIFALVAFVAHGCAFLNSVKPPAPKTVSEALAVASTGVRVTATAISGLRHDAFISMHEAVVAFKIVDKANKAINQGWELWRQRKMVDAQRKADAAQDFIDAANETVTLGNNRKAGGI